MDKLTQQQYNLKLEALTEYMQPGVTLQAVADKFGIDFESLKEVALAEGWEGRKTGIQKELNYENENLLDAFRREHQLNKSKEILRVSGKFVEHVEAALNDTPSIDAMERLSKVYKSQADLQRSVLSLIPKKQTEIDVNINNTGLQLGGAIPVKKQDYIDVEAHER